MVKAKTLKFGNPPDFRNAKKGLNIFGYCTNKKCETNGKEVIYTTKLGIGLIFALNNEILNIKCPICHKVFKPRNCRFYKCEYQFEGKKIEEGDVKEFESEPKETEEEKFEYFLQLENEEVQWIELNIYVLPLQDIKYQKN